MIVLSPDAGSPDSQVIKALLALVNAPDRRKEPYHIVAEIRDPRNVSVAKMVGKDEVEVILAGDLIARIAVQTLRQSGLSLVYTELLDFGGDEIYFQKEPALSWKTFGDAVLAYEDSSIIGLCNEKGEVRLNPPMSSPIEPHEMLIAVSEDDDTVKLSGLKDLGIEVDAIRDAKLTCVEAEKILILGWNEGGPTTLRELDHYAPEGSTARIVADAEDAEGAIEVVSGKLERLKVTFQDGDTTDRTLLESLDVTHYNRVMVLAYTGDVPVEDADARTLITLLHLREISAAADRRVSIVSQMLDVRNRVLAEATRADDFVVSDRLVSLLMTQISENKKLARVFEDLFDAQGVQLSLRPVEDYLATGRALNFYTAVESAKRKNQVALGYRKMAHASDAAKSYGVVVNPEKSARVTFDTGDKLLVLSAS